jgi:hypothetical protein
MSHHLMSDERRQWLQTIQQHLVPEARQAVARLLERDRLVRERLEDLEDLEVIPVIITFN